MNRILSIGVFSAAIITLIAYLYLNFFADTSADKLSVMSDLEKTGGDCTSIAEKAAINLPEALPFQKLEKAARQARVMQTCMNDRGFIQNPAWMQFINPIAQQLSVEQHVSFNEAFETLSRKNMYLLSTKANQPLYWVAAKTTIDAP